MSVFTIKKGNHSHVIPPFLGGLPWFGQCKMARRITFDDSCQYESTEYHSEDVNKLFGLSFGVLPRRVKTSGTNVGMAIGDSATMTKWVSPGHYNSARFGWVWSVKYTAWKLLDYGYALGVKNWDEQLRFKEVCRVSPGQVVDCFLNYAKNSGILTLDVELYLGENVANAPLANYRTQLAKNLPSYGLQQGFYFGGIPVTPHTMKCCISKIK